MERDFISFLTLQDALEILKLQVINKDILTYDLTKQDYHLEENSLYRSDSFCVILVKSGVVSYISNGEYLTLYAGDILFSPILETFSIEYLSDDYVASYILFTEKPITQAGFNYHNLLKELRQGDSLIINGQPELFARMKFHIGEISRLNSNTLQEYFMEDMISHHFSIILFELSNYIKKDGYSRNLLSRDEEITTKFFTLVKEKYRFEHSVQFYAEQLFITRKYLSKVIKKQWTKRLRTLLIKQLL